MKLLTGKFAVPESRHIIVVDTREPGWRERLPRPIAVAIGNLAALPENEEVYVVARDPSPAQALRHTRVSIHLLLGALWRNWCGYCRRINRGYNAANYQFRNPEMN